MKRNANAVLVEKIFNQPGGSFVFTTSEGHDEPAGMLYQCPCGCGAIHGANFKGYGGGYAEWDWDGNRDKPTLSPSLGLWPKDDKGNYHWHGFLKAGVFEEC